MEMNDELEAALLAFAAEARRIEPRVHRVSFRDGEQRTVLLLELLDAPPEVMNRLQGLLGTYRMVKGIDCDVIVTNSTKPKFLGPPEVPDCWQPK